MVGRLSQVRLRQVSLDLSLFVSPSFPELPTIMFILILILKFVNIIGRCLAEKLELRVARAVFQNQGRAAHNLVLQVIRDKPARVKATIFPIRIHWSVSQKL